MTSEVSEACCVEFKPQPRRTPTRRLSAPIYPRPANPVKSKPSKNQGTTIRDFPRSAIMRNRVNRVANVARLPLQAWPRLYGHFRGSRGAAICGCIQATGSNGSPEWKQCLHALRSWSPLTIHALLLRSPPPPAYQYCVETDPQPVTLVASVRCMLRLVLHRLHLASGVSR